MKLTGALISFTLSLWQTKAFVVGPRHRTTAVSKRAPLFVQVKDDGSWKTDFLDRIPEVPATAPKKATPAPKEPEPAAPAPAPIPSATTPIGVSTETATQESPPAPAPVVAAPPPASPKQVAPAPSSPESAPSDLPIPLIAGGALAAFAAATFAMRGSVDEREEGQSGGGSSTAPATTVAATPVEPEPELPPATDDVSIPYHAAAQLAYEESDKKMSYDEFQAKYEADAVADVKAKQKK